MGSEMCIRDRVVNTVPENAMPQPARYTLEHSGLSSVQLDWLHQRGEQEFAMMMNNTNGAGVKGAVKGISARTFVDGCVVSAANTKQQMYFCRQVALSRLPDGGALQMQDWVGAGQTALYRIGCNRDASNGGALENAMPPSNLVFDGSFERTMQPLIPGYNIDGNHQSFWIVALPQDGNKIYGAEAYDCLLYTSPSPRDS